ncbi:hypothetical protein Pelo_553 [Pelomyxa schiedti]|nr:hypothetical protein Pelo_553 [Pelomyxa schiedti]
MSTSTSTSTAATAAGPEPPGAGAGRPRGWSRKTAVFIGGPHMQGDVTEWGTEESWHNPNWSVRFDVDEDGNVSGGNRNEGVSQPLKTYSGTFKNGHMRIVSNHDVTYESDLTNGQMCRVVLTHASSGRSVGRGIAQIKTG